MLASAEGADGTPAYRGTAYAVFQDLQLADFGNHIPSLTFEVEADAGAVDVGAIAAELSGGAIGGATLAALDGYAASGDSVRGAIEALADAIPLSIADDGATLLVSDAAPDPITLDAGELGAGADGKRMDGRSIERAAAGTLPDEVSVEYYEPARDYQAGLQRARRGGPGRRVEKIGLPAALSASAAKAIAEYRLADAWAARATATATLPWRRAEVRPGAGVVLAGAPMRYRVSGWSLDHMVVRLSLAGVAAGARSGAVAAPGRGAREEDAPQGPTTLALLDLPPLDEAAGSTPCIWIAAAGSEPGWRRAALIASLDGGASWEELGSTAAPAVLGTAQSVLSAGDAALFDRGHHVDVALLNDAMWLEGRDDDALVAGANVALLGEELIQFGDAEPLGGGCFRLSRLLRGRRGTDYAMASHAAGEQFVLIDRQALAVYALPAAALGAEVRVLASGVGDANPAEAARIASARALRPPSPVLLTATRLGDGTVRFGWTRRSRIGWAWLDGGDAPLGEESERYRLQIAPDVGIPRTVESGTPFYAYTPAEQASDGASGAAAFAVSLIQLGSVAPSAPPAARTFIL